jgi:succinate dehydrogenase cytochrome b556 subunit
MAERAIRESGRSEPSIARPVERATWQGSGATEKPAWGWILQAITGAALLVLVTLHMIANHFMVSRGLRDSADVQSYFSDPLVVAIEVTFLAVVVWHGLLGLRSILFDFGFSTRTERRITWILTVVGVASVVYGVWLTAVIVSRG